MSRCAQTGLGGRVILSVRMTRVSGRSAGVQGKGKMMTYWLTGKDGFTKPLPTDEMRVSASQHDFK